SREVGVEQRRLRRRQREFSQKRVLQIRTLAGRRQRRRFLAQQRQAPMKGFTVAAETLRAVEIRQTLLLEASHDRFESLGRAGAANENAKTIAVQMAGAQLIR